MISLPKFTRFVTICSFLIWPVLSCLGQESAEKTAPPSIRVTGEGRVTSRPDQAEIDIGVISQAETAQAAAAQNAQRLDSVLNDLRKVLGSNADIKTISYSVTPDYRYPKEGARPVISGYSASNVVQVRMSDLTAVGKIVDLATRSGANTIQRLVFTLKDENQARSEALRNAAVSARAKANAIAAALGLKIVRVLLAEETGTVMPMHERFLAGAAQADVARPTPVEPGTIDTRAVVTLTVQVAAQD